MDGLWREHERPWRRMRHICRFVSIAVGGAIKASEGVSRNACKAAGFPADTA
jgi:hypothetical protein